MIRVLLADDDAMLRVGVAAILGSDPEIEVVAEAGDGAEAVELARLHRPDVVLLDIRMPTMDGLDAAAELRRAGCPVRNRVIIRCAMRGDRYAAPPATARTAMISSRGSAAFSRNPTAPSSIARVT